MLQVSYASRRDTADGSGAAQKIGLGGGWRFRKPREMPSPHAGYAPVGQRKTSYKGIEWWGNKKIVSFVKEKTQFYCVKKNNID
jgi:hypothetical protein